MPAPTSPPDSRFHVDPDITRASTLPRSFCLDDDTLCAEAREHIFARSWQWLDGLADVREPGSLSPRALLTGLLDEPLLPLPAFENACDFPSARDDPPEVPFGRGGDLAFASVATARRPSCLTSHR